jgi:hypothetical protein
MKLLLVLTLTFSIFADFASTSFFEGESLSHVESSISCTDTELHTSSDKDHHESHEDEHHCHVGHFHNFVINSTVSTKILAPNLDTITLFPIYSLGKTQHYLSDINRPPIS